MSIKIPAAAAAGALISILVGFYGIGEDNGIEPPAGNPGNWQKYKHTTIQLSDGSGTQPFSCQMVLVIINTTIQLSDGSGTQPFSCKMVLIIINTTIQLSDGSVYNQHNHSAVRWFWL